MRVVRGGGLRLVGGEGFGLECLGSGDAGGEGEVAGGAGGHCTVRGWIGAVVRLVARCGVAGTQMGKKRWICV